MRLSIHMLVAGLGLAMVAWPLVAVGQTQQRATGPRTSQPLGPAVQNPQPAQEPPLRMANNPRPLATPQAPAWYPQPAQHQQYVADVLKYWEQSSSKIERYKCSFRRWEYDPAWVKADPETGKSPAVRVSYGKIMYGRPDKGKFEVTKVLHYSAPKAPGEKPQYLENKGEVGEHWVCDGKSIFEFDHGKKTLIDHQLPPDMQGKSIVDGPLPFLFGAEAAKIQERYWVGVFTPKTAKGEYWLEAWPKRAEDAKNYRKVEIIIDEKDFLPKALQIFNHEGTDANPSSTVLTFDDREVNFPLQSVVGSIIDPFQIWLKEFHEPTVPLGWKKVVERFDKASGEQPAATANSVREQTNQAMRMVPLSPKKK